MQQREALKLHYGWDNNKCMTLDEISLILNVGYSKIRYIEFTALKHMRNSNWGRKRSTDIIMKGLIIVILVLAKR